MKIKPEAETEIIKNKLRKTQKEWIDYFNKKGELQISSPDIYKVAKSENKELIASLTEDMIENVIMTSTQVKYKKKTLNATITHYAGSTLVPPKQYKVKIPYILGKAEENKETEKYLQALFDTKDDIATIMKVLKKFDKTKKLYLWTPDQSSRANKQIRSVDVFFDGDRFGVDADRWFDVYDGLSRGVVIDSAKQSRKGGKNEH